MTILDTFEKLSAEIETLRKECGDLYEKWHSACDRLHKLDRERKKVFLGLFDGHSS